MIRPSDSMHATGKLWRITGLESKLRFRLAEKAKVRLPHAPEILFEDKTNPLFATVVNGICYITAGNYEVVYEATEKLKKIYSVESKLEDLLTICRYGHFCRR